MKCGIFLNISLWFFSLSYLCVDWGNPRREWYLYIMWKNHRTKGRAWFSSLTAHTLQQYNICNNKYNVPEFPIFTMIVSLYDSSISDTYSFMFAIQSMIVTPSPKAKAINRMTCYLYRCGLFFVTNIIITSIIVLFDFMQYPHSCNSKYWFFHHI